MGITIGTQVLRGEPSGGGGSVTDITAADITDATSTGRDVLTGTAAEGLDALHERTVYDFSSSSGWTTSGGTDGAASISGGNASVSLPGATTAQWYGSTGHLTAPRIYRAAPRGDFTVRARIRLSGANSLTRAGIYVRRASVDARLAQIMVRDNGTLTAQTDSGSSFTDGVGGLITIAGDPWLRLDVRGGHYEYFVSDGDGTNTEPSDWTLLAVSATVATGSLPLDEVGFAVGQYNGGASGPTLRALRFILRSL